MIKTNKARGATIHLIPYYVYLYLYNFHIVQLNIKLLTFLVFYVIFILYNFANPACAPTVRHIRR